MEQIAFFPFKKQNKIHFLVDSRGEQPARLLGQPQTCQQADDQVHDEEQQVGEPPAETDGRQKIKPPLVDACFGKVRSVVLCGKGISSCMYPGSFFISVMFALIQLYSS